MEEERIIRITEADCVVDPNSGRYYVKSMYVETYFEELEMAPIVGSVSVDPSWLPACYDHDYEKNTCKARFLDDGSMDLACVFCHIINKVD